MKNAELITPEKPDLSKSSPQAIAVALAYDTLSQYGKNLINFIIKQERTVVEKEAMFKQYLSDIE